MTPFEIVTYFITNYLCVAIGYLFYKRRYMRKLLELLDIGAKINDKPGHNAILFAGGIILSYAFLTDNLEDARIMLELNGLNPELLNTEAANAD